ncbi:hypothetical protein SCARR_02925 [Pontiella sulfatireligans]|uniref:Fibronectin type-III domain-containing protein n=2 Tax=Pontiella sulfatireligans TaxID=2750658 RepID=A0A6C2UL80_9BACT|nr:hypothetical protein SCARR_02925 [Pontiella sulfatireligans]
MKMRGITLFAALLGMAIGTQAALPEIGDTIWLKGGTDNSYVYASGSALVAKAETDVANALNFVVHSADGSDSNFIFQVADTTSYVIVVTNNDDILTIDATALTNNPLTHFTMTEITEGTYAGTYELSCLAHADPVVHERGNTHTLKAHSTSGGSIRSAWTYGVVGAALEPPTGLGANTSDSQVVLDWDNDVSGLLDTYTVYRSTNTPVTISDTLLGSPSNSQFTDTNVVNGTTYYYAVTATDGSTETDLSNEVSATPPTGTAQPKRLKALGVPAAVLLDWADDTTGHLDYYTVYRSTTTPVTTGSPVLTNVTASAFTDFDVVAGTTNYYAVTAVGTNGVPPESALSDEVSAIPFAAVTETVLFQHIDATVAASVQTDGVTNGMGIVTDVVDQSTFGNDATDVADGDDLGPVLWPSTDLFGSGRAGFDMGTDMRMLNLFTNGTDALLDFTGDASGSDGFAMLVAFKTRTMTEGVANIFLNNGPISMEYDGDDGEMTVELGSATLTQSGAGVEAGDTIVYALNYNALTGETTFWDSKNNEEVSVTAEAHGDFSGDPLQLGGSGRDSRIFDGLMGEVKIFSTKLPADQFEAQRDALRLKWVSADATGFDVWVSSWGVNLGSATNDWDNDGINNLAEYAFAGNPTNGTDDTYTDLVTDGGLVYIHPQPKNDADLNYAVLTMDNLPYDTWTDEGYTAVIGTYVPAEGDYNYVSNSVPTTDAVKFIRASAEY